MGRRVFEKKMGRAGKDTGCLILTKEILGEDFEAPVGTVLKIVREKDHIKVYPLKKSWKKTKVKVKENKEVKEESMVTEPSRSKEG